MRVSIDQDGLSGDRQGYARVRIELEPGDNFSIEKGDGITLGQYNGPNLEFVNPKGGPDRLGQAKTLKMETEPKIDSKSAEFLLQPAYVDNLEDGNYEVYLLGVGDKIKGTGRGDFYDIVYSPLQGKNLISVYQAEEEPESENEEESTSDGAAVQSDDHDGASGDTTDSDSTADSGSPADAAAPPLPIQQPKSNIGLILAIVGVVVLLVTGAGGYFYYTKIYKPTHAEELAKEEANKKAAEEAAKAEAEKKAADAAKAEADRIAAEEAAKADTRGRVGKFFAGERTPEGAMALAAEVAKDTAEQKDAAFRLYYYAAENGNAEGAQKYAECVDPTLPGWGSIRKNGAEAWRYYGKSPNGTEAQAKVKQWIEEQAGRGNKNARAWLQELE